MVHAPLIGRAQQLPDRPYGITLPSRTVLQQNGQQAFIQRLNQHPLLKPASQPVIQVRGHAYRDRTVEFLLLLLFHLKAIALNRPNPLYHTSFIILSFTLLFMNEIMPLYARSSYS